MLTYDQLAADVSEAMNFPPTDDPIEVLRAIAALIGDSNYTYFDNSGTWVPYPKE